MERKGSVLEAKIEIYGGMREMGCKIDTPVTYSAYGPGCSS